MNANKPLAGPVRQDESAATIGQRIRIARKAAGLNQGALAERLGVTQPTVANWEAGVHDPRQLMLAKLSDSLDVSLGWLAGGERSEAERDRSPAAPYVRRPIQHVPVLDARSAGQVACGRMDPHDAATDYIPITYGGGRLAAVFLPEEAVPGEIGADTLVVIDYDRRQPMEGDLVAMSGSKGPRLRRWRRPVAQVIGAEAEVLGTVIASIRFH